MKKGKLMIFLVIIFISLLSFLVLMNTGISIKVFRLNADVSLNSNETMFLPGFDVNSKIKELGGAAINPYNGSIVEDWKNENITQIKRSTTISSENEKSDNIVSTGDSPNPIYMWYSNKVIYYYTTASTIYLNPDSSGLFEYLTKLTSIDITDFNTSKVTNMSNMFNFCTSLKTVDLSRFDTSNVTNMNSMFYKCESLTSLDLSSFNTSKVTDMSSIFCACYNLKSLDVSSFNTSNVTDMFGMFAAYTTNDKMSLTSITGLNSFDTSKVTNMSYMFWGDAYLTSIDVSSFDTSNVTDMAHMFDGCESVTNLNLNSFDTNKVTNMDLLFEDCRKLRKIYVSKDFVTNKVTNNNRMFYNCDLLTGEKGTKYNENNIYKSYAIVDKAGSPGYFSAIYKINYHGNGGTYNNKDSWLDPREFKYNEVYPSSSNRPIIYSNDDFFVRDGYTFKGWKTKAGYAGWSVNYSGDSDKLWKWTNEEYGIGDEVKYQLDLYAEWEEETIDLSKLNIRDNRYIVFENGETLSEIKELINYSNLVLKDKNDKNKGDNVFLATNDKLIIKDTTYIIVVLGDIDGDGLITIKDLYQSYLLYKNKATNLNEYQIYAGDYNNDNMTNIRDLYEIYLKMRGR